MTIGRTPYSQVSAYLCRSVVTRNVDEFRNSGIHAVNSSIRRARGEGLEQVGARDLRHWHLPDAELATEYAGHLAARPEITLDIILKDNSPGQGLDRGRDGRRRSSHSVVEQRTREWSDGAPTAGAQRRRYRYCGTRTAVTGDSSRDITRRGHPRADQW